MVGNKNKIRIRIIDIVAIIYIITIFLFTDDLATNYISQIAFILFLMIALLNIFIIKKTINISVIKFYLPIVLFSWASIPFAMESSLALEKAITLSTLVLFSIILFNCYNSSGNINNIVLAFAIAGCCLACQVIADSSFSQVVTNLITGRRVGKDVLQLNYLGRYTSLSALSAFYLGYYKGYKLSYFIFAVSILICLASESRQAILTLAINLVILYLAKDFSRKKLLTIVKVLIVGVIGILLLQLPALANLKQRLYLGFTVINDSSNGIISDKKRLDMIQLGIKVFINNPVVGIGLGNVRNIVSGIIYNYKYLHNNYVELLACGGIVGFISYYSIYVVLFSKLHKKLKSKTYGSKHIFAGVLLFAQLISDVFAVNYYSKIQYVIFTYAFITLFRHSRRKLLT